MAYRIFLTDALRAIAKNTANIRGGEYPQMRFKDMINPDSSQLEDRSPDQIIADMKEKLRRLSDD